MNRTVAPRMLHVPHSVVSVTSMEHAQPDSPHVIAATLRRTAVAQADSRTDLAARALAVARSTALGVLGDAAAAEDVAQEVAIVAVQRARSLRDPAKLDAWLHKVAVRKAIDETRKRHRRRTVELEEHHEPGRRTARRRPRARAARSPPPTPARRADAALRPRPARRRDRPRARLPPRHRSLAAQPRPRSPARDLGDRTMKDLLAPLSPPSRRTTRSRRCWPG